MKHDQIYINLPVKDLQRSRTFFEALGYGFEPRFSNDSGACLVLGDNLFVMLLTVPFFQTFTKKPVADAKAATEVLVCVTCSSRDAVDALVAKALAAGGSVPVPPQDNGAMYGHGFEDLDGHQWELFHMAATPPAA